MPPSEQSGAASRPPSPAPPSPGADWAIPRTLPRAARQAPSPEGGGIAATRAPYQNPASVSVPERGEDWAIPAALPRGARSLPPQSGSGASVQPPDNRATAPPQSGQGASAPLPYRPADAPSPQPDPKSWGDMGIPAPLPYRPAPAPPVAAPPTTVPPATAPNAAGNTGPHRRKRQSPPRFTGKGRGRRVAAAAFAVLLLAGAGGVWVFRDSLFGGRPGGPGGGDAAAGSVRIPMSVDVSGEAGDGARAHNAGMAGLCAFDGQTVYTSDGESVVDGAGSTVYSGVLYAMNADAGVLYGINDRGEIIAVSADGSGQIIRSAGYPSRLTLSGGALYFIEDGIFRMDLSGGGETQLSDYSPDSFTVSGGAAYYIGGDARLWRAAGGGSAVALDQIVDYFCFDREQLYFTAAGSGELYLLPPEGQPRPVSGAMGGLLSPRFAVNGEYLYFGEPGGGVYRAPLEGGETETIRADGCLAFYLLPDSVYCLGDLPPAPVYALTDQQ